MAHLGFSFPDNVSGNYHFEHLINQLAITGTGNWARVPEPDTLWSLALGLLTLGGVQWLIRRHLELNPNCMLPSPPPCMFSRDYFMRTNLLFIGLLLAVLLCASPASAITISGSALVDWSALTMTGINFTLSNFHEVLSADVRSQTGFVSDVSTPSAWVPATTSATLSSVGSATANASASTINSSFSVFSDRAFAGQAVERNVTITALTTGFLTVSIPYQVQIQGPTFGEWTALASAFVQFTNLNLTGGISSGGFLEYRNGSGIPVIGSGPTPSGVALLTIPFSQGQVGLLNFSARGGVSVPEPATLWSLAIALVLLVSHSRMASPPQK
jgi:hypothetical protein